MGGPLGQYGGLGDEEKAMAAMKMKARFEVLQEQEFLEELLAVVLVDHADKGELGVWHACAIYYLHLFRIDKGSAIATAASEFLVRSRI